MTDITYQIDRDDSTVTKVYLDKKLVGCIIEFSNSFYYQPKDTKIKGESFPTIRAVKRSIEGTD